MTRVADAPKQEAPSAKFAPRVSAVDSGSAIVGLHGFGGAAAVFDPIARALRDVATLWSADGFGHRGARWPDEVHDFGSGVGALRAAVTEVPSPRYLLGYSMGARLGLAAWTLDPALFEGATLIGVHPGLADAEERDERRRLDAARAESLRTRGVQSFFEEWDASPLFVGRDAHDMSWRCDHGADALARAFEIWSLGQQPDLGAALDRLVEQGRAQLLVGSADAKFRRLLARWRPRILPGSHDLVTASPDRVARAVRRHRSSLASPESRGA